MATIYEVLKAKLGREPSYEEVKADVKRILNDGLVELAQQGRLPHQLKNRKG